MHKVLNTKGIPRFLKGAHGTAVSCAWHKIENCCSFLLYATILRSPGSSENLQLAGRATLAMTLDAQRKMIGAQ
jgi:hypothetical protein